MKCQNIVLIRNGDKEKALEKLYMHRTLSVSSPAGSFRITNK